MEIEIDQREVLRSEIESTFQAEEKAYLGEQRLNDDSAARAVPCRGDQKATKRRAESTYRPTISMGMALPEKTQEVLKQLIEKPSNDFVINESRACRIVVRNGFPIIEPHNRETLRGVVARHTSFVRSGPNGDANVDPPNSVLDDVINLPSFPEGIPRVVRIQHTPLLTSQGELLTGTGLDLQHGVYFHLSPELREIEVPDEITKSHIDAAIQVLLEPFSDFPFATSVDRANLVALILATLFRDRIDGLTPIALIDGNVPGIGKGLLLTLVHLIAFGYESDFSIGKISSEELRKRLFALAAEGVSFHVLDNVEGRLWQDALAAFSTASHFRDRILGSSKTAAYPNRIVLTATGNQLRVGGDIARRCFLLQLKSGLARPSERNDFTHPYVKAFVREHRADILTAAYTLVASYLRAGSPAPTTVPAMGSFEAFVHFTAGVIEHIGFAAVPFSNRDMIVERDEEGEELALLLCRAREQFADQPFTAKQLAAVMLPDEVPMCLASRNGTPLPPRLGRLLGRIEGRVYGQEHFVIRQHDIQAHMKRYRVDVIPN